MAANTGTAAMPAMVSAPGGERQGRTCRQCGKDVTVKATDGIDVPPPRAVHTATGLEAGDDGHTVAPIDAALQGNAPAKAPKPTPDDLGIDLEALAWQRSGDGDGALEVAIPDDPRWQRGDWVLMRKAGDPDGRVLVYDRNEWECFLDGVRNREFDDLAEPATI
jgi:hypothetical protein